MSTAKYKRKLVFYMLLFCVVGFLNLFFLSDGKDITPIIIMVVMLFFIVYSSILVRKLFPDGDMYIYIFSCILCIIGIMLLYRLDMLNRYLVSINSGDLTNYGLKQLIWFAIGTTCYILTVILLPNIKKFKSLRYIYLIITVVLISLPSFFGEEIFGAKNWIVIKGFSFQPSEFAKLTLVFYLASALKEYKKSKDLIEPAIVVMICLFFMVAQKDLGSALIFFGISLTMLYISTNKIKYILTCIVLFLLGGYGSYVKFYHVKMRVLVWLNPFAYASDSGYQIIQSLIAISEGGLFGKGLGFGHPEYIPVNASDFIFSVLCEDMGIVMGFAVLIIYFLLFYRCMRVGVYVKDNFSRMVAVGYSAMIACQVLVIVGGVTKLVPLTGITLPLISYGGSSMLTTFFALGIIQKVSEEEKN
ncbi:MAG: FtsW/RodA/SpoVE family cell cycle protein [Clostridiaceae bacterium]